ncbi:DUF4148 domain-containing protein [Bordetella genomosp. 5]|uniref:DUF4148 domain-containing protein n=1 Tax=Bordetella genomosp. 5 TaxID=1395608 RepID=A0A261U2F3_9BORD|nr:DUF4148 domain-containing protein [Bordetella genomosp. 5]OZI55420.1 hypothetical protein CAL25_03220 [Bordetella genomosp. 5]
MKNKLAAATLAVMALAGLSAAHAEGKSREQVQTELRDAKAAGQVTSGELDYPPAAASVTQDARAAGTTGVSTGDRTAPAAAPATRGGKTRDEVRAELQQAKAAGKVTFGELDYPPADD